MPDCPDDTELAGFLNESLPVERHGHVSGHVDGCPLCQARLDRLTDQTSGAVARYKELSSSIMPDAGSGPGVVEDTLIIGGKPAVPTAFVGLPRVPGFDVIAEIGRGGMGVVYKARHRRLNRLVALKMILAGTAADPRVVQRFLFEAEFLARIQHPQVVQVFEVDMYEGPNGVPIPYLAMELLEGGSLARKLKEHTATDGASRWPSTRAAAELVEGLARAVHAAHLQGVIHRDLKPGNILFPTSGGQWAVDSSDKKSAPSSPPTAPPKVLDFGLAKFTQDAGTDLTQSGQVVGTPQYMAPEQAAGGRAPSPAVDVYALGAILFECLAGRPPFVGGEPMSVLLKVVNEQPPDVRSLRPDIPRDLAAVTMKCLEKDPNRRYASAEALADDLRRFLEDRPTRARPVTNLERSWLWAKRNPTIAGLVAALVVVVVTAFGTFASLWMRAEQKARDEHAAQQRANRAAEESDRSLKEMQRQKALAEFREARLEFGRAVETCEEGRVEEGLRLFLRTVEMAEAIGEADLARVARANLAAWPRDLPPTRHALAHNDQPRQAAFHPDGQHVVTAGRRGELFRWDLATRQKVHTYKPVPGIGTVFGPGTIFTYWTVAISPDGLTVAAAGSDGDITLWDFASADHRITFKASGEKNNLWSIAFAPDGTLWATDGETGLKRWDLTARPRPKAIAHLPPPPDTLQIRDNLAHILVLSPDGKQAYTGERAGVLREWNLEKGVLARTWATGGWVQDVALSPDGSRVAVTGPAGVARVYNLKTGKEILTLNLAGAYGNGVAFSPKRPFVVTTDGDGNVRFWHNETGQPIGIPMRLHGAVTRPRFQPNSDLFAVPAGNTVCLCRVPDPPGDLITAGHGIRVRGLDFSPNSQQIAVADDNVLEVFVARTSERVQSVRIGADPLSIRFDTDPSQTRIFRGTRSGADVVTLFDKQKHEPLTDFGTLRVSQIEFVPRKQELLVLGSSLVGRFDSKTLKRLAVAKPAPDIPVGVELGALAVRSDGAEALVAFADRVVFVNVATLEWVREWRVGDEVLDARYTPDGTKVLVGRRDNVAELLDARTGQPVAAAMPHTRAVPAVAVSPDGTMLLTGSRDGAARFWDAATGLPLGAPLRHMGPVTHVIFAPNGEHVVTGTGTGHVMLWDLPPPPAQGTTEELRGKLKLN